MVKSIADEGEYQQALAKHASVMVKFSAKWCGPCKAVAPIIEKMQPKFPDVFMCDVDVDDNHDVAKLNKVTAMPTFVFFKNGTETARIMGGNIPQITAELQTLQAAAKVSFGTGSRLGSSAQSSSLRLDSEAVRNARLRAIGALSSEKKADASSQPEKATTKAASGSPAVTTTSSSSGEWSISSLVNNLVKWIVLYFATLFTLDSRAAANKYSR